MTVKAFISMPPRPQGKSYEPFQFEMSIYRFWEENGCFEASDESAPGQKAYSIMIPPPNVTGVLHMGHALTNTIQDILIRWHRMKGENTLWLPGTDHAGIATQMVVEKQIAKEGKGPTGKPLTRHDLGRDEFLKRIWKWKEENGTQITEQLKRLGSSLDWKRERFTMDEGLSHSVREVFVRLYEDGLIYRGERIINWCPRCQTALSDLEVIPTDRKGNLWHIAYVIVDEAGDRVKNPDGSDASVVIATTRPETLLGDSAIAVHPEDERYAPLKGKFAVVPLVGRKIPLIQDEYVDREFGSGALKVTPAHDFNDSELGKRHNLEIIQVMGKDGTLTEAAGPYNWLKYVAPQGKMSEAREKILVDLTEQGALVNIEDHTNRVGLCQRCDAVAEPMISKQWFVKIETLAKPAIEAVETGRIEFVPKIWEKTYFEWMRNIRDWCISRQLWWGHQIPAWYCDQGHVTVSRTAPEKCNECSSVKLEQDEDVLDTWFSSALWPFSTLGWPEKTKALETFYPNSVMETGFDIIFFWVARMIMMGMHFMGDVPFKKVFLHAMVRDEKGEKMSKTRGNVIDPLNVIGEQGADPLRFCLAAMAGQGRDIKLSMDRVEGYHAFANKLWNAVKFFHMHFEEQDAEGTPRLPIPDPEKGAGHWLMQRDYELIPQNQWILSQLQDVVVSVNAALEKFEVNEAARILHDFVWHEFCDWYIELIKLPIMEDGPIRIQVIYTYRHVLEGILRLLHPFMPYVTEELWQTLPWKKPVTTTAREKAGLAPIQTLMLQAYPTALQQFKSLEAERTIGTIKVMVEALRNFRGENNISARLGFLVRYTTQSPASDAFIRMHDEIICHLAKLSEIRKIEPHEMDPNEIEAVIPISSPPIELRIALKGLVNVEEESKRVVKEIDRLNADISFIDAKLSKESFIAKAPQTLVSQEKGRRFDLIKKRTELEAQIQRLSKLKD